MIELIPITDPNQLTLGLESQVLTADQHLELQRSIATVNSQAERLVNDLRNKRELLLGAGFTEDEFVFEIIESTEMRTFNVASWREPEVLVEAEVKYASGGCAIKYNQLNYTTGEIEERLAHFTNERGNKVSCSYLMNSYRAVKAETLKRKVVEKNQDAIMNKHGFDSRKNTTTQTIEKYSKLCPTATVVADEVWLNSRTRKVIKVTFPNGSFIDLETGYEFGKERIVRFVDVKTSGLDPEQLAAYFNAQV
jgi:hypothetical protein